MAQGVEEFVLPDVVRGDDHLVHRVAPAEGGQLLARAEHGHVERRGAHPVARHRAHDVHAEPVLRPDGGDHLGRGGVGAHHQDAPARVAAEQRAAAETPGDQQRRVERRQHDEDRARKHEVLAEEVDSDQHEGLEPGGHQHRAHVIARPGDSVHLVEPEEVEDRALREQQLRPVVVHLGEADAREIALRQRQGHMRAQDEGEQIGEAVRQQVARDQDRPAQAPSSVASVHRPRHSR